MECYRHPGAASVATCVACNQAICPDCREEVAGHPMCRPCVIAAEARIAEEAPPSAGAGAPEAPEGAPSPVVMAEGEAEAPDATPQPEAIPPGVVRRIARGVGWGLLYGQWWTLWTIISSFIWHRSSMDGNTTFYFIFMGIVYAFFGSLTGLIIGASNASENTGANIGVGVGITICLGEMALSRDFTSLINLFFYYFTGRYVGAGITGRVQRPIGFRPPPAAVPGAAQEATNAS